VAESVLIAIVSQVVATLFASFIQRRFEPPESILEVRPGSETVIVHQTIVRLGPFAFERAQRETRIVGATFRRAKSPALVSDHRLPFLFGVVTFVAVLAAFALA